MNIHVAGLGAKHTLACEPSDSIRSVKQRLEPLTALAAAEMKLLVKGKAPDDSTTLETLGVADGAKIMLMRSAQGAKSAKPPASKASNVPGAPAWCIVGATVDYVDGNGEAHPAAIKALHTDDPEGGLYCTVSLEGGERQTPIDRLRLRGSSAATIAAAASASAAGCLLYTSPSPRDS